LKKDLKYWKEFFNSKEIPNYVGSGGTIGEYVVFVPVKKLVSKEKDGFSVDSLIKTTKYAASNDIFSYAANYMKKKYGKPT